jgi:aspartyl-tRNA(Asn)/glutamyl-tRNA(Gln) amidotransferase subunit A
MAEPYDLSLSEAAAAIRERRLSPTELLGSVLGRFERVEPRVFAWARLLPEEARREARRLTDLQASGTILGPLHGIPIGVKDIFYTAGIETSCGSRIMAAFIPSYDATAVARLREAGAIVLGKTHTTEFASFDPSPARNPWALDHTPGGSSSGSGAALAARTCHGALGSQTSGSIVRPSAFCGVVGLKPTFGRVSRYGVHPLAWTLDHPGPMARTVRDVAVLLDVIAGPDPRDPTTLTTPPPAAYAASLDGASDEMLRRLRIGVPDRYFTDGLDPEAERAYRSAIDALARLGCQIREVTLPEIFEAGMDAHEIIHNVEAAAVHVDRYRTRAAEYGHKLRAIIETGLRVPGPTYVRAQQVRTVLIEAMRTLLRQVDVLATPAAPGPAPRGLHSTGSPVMNRPFSFLGFPSLTVPCGLTGATPPREGSATVSREGSVLPSQPRSAPLPLGLQLAGRPWDEVTILRIAAAYEAATPWATRAPSL